MGKTVTTQPPLRRLRVALVREQLPIDRTYALETSEVSRITFAGGVAMPRKAILPGKSPFADFRSLVKWSLRKYCQ